MNVSAPRLVAWEITRRCNLHCRHCRAAAENGPYAGELSAAEARDVVDDLAAIGSPILILTGGEPLLCDWLWEIAAYARQKGLRAVLGTNATLVDDAVAARVAQVGIRRASVSIDFPEAVAQDRFRGERGAFEKAIRGAEALRRAGVGVQVNTTVTKANRALLPRLHDLAVRLGAEAFHPFLLVPTGRGTGLSSDELSAEEYEETLRWVCEARKNSPLELKPTDAPQYQRILRQQGGVCGKCVQTKGCLAGTAFAFIGHRGDVQPCGTFDLPLGNVRQTPFSEIWRTSPVLDDLRHPERLKGKCGVCEYKTVCGGCRARALARTGDYLAEEPHCLHVPEKALLDRLQGDFPFVEHPYAELGREFGLTEEACFERVKALAAAGLIRRIGAFFDNRALGLVSTLAALAVPPDRLDDVAAQVGALPGVTHNYARKGRYNLWFTLVRSSREELTAALAELSRRTGLGPCLDLPALKTYKLRVDFSPSSSVRAVPTKLPPPCVAPSLSPSLLALRGNLIDRGLTPFAGLDLATLRALRTEGVVRRLGAVVNPRAIGYRANALTAWQVPSDRVDAVGEVLARSPNVSHCYERRPCADWPHNLYAMVHERTAEDLARCLSVLETRAKALVPDLPTPVFLPTEREYGTGGPLSQ